MRSLDIAATGMQAQQLNIEVISNNLANMTTTGYKRQRAEFQDLIYQHMRRVGTNSADVGTIVPTGISLGLGVKAGSIYRVTEQGDMQNTGNALDLAVQGLGYFQVEMPDGTTAYTRSGSFQLSPDGEIVTQDGYLVSPAITIPNNATDVSINRSGQVIAQIAGQQTPQQVGQIELANFINSAGLAAMGDNLFSETEASGAPVIGNPAEDEIGSLLQGFLETSNVNPVDEITTLIMAQRAYEMNSKVITATDEMMQTLSQAV